ncbi:MAG: histidine phosphatase family protein [Gammaproteobacteria bacterium]
MRHGKSSWDAPVKRDFDRPLAKRGRRDAPRVGDWMADNGHVPDEVICSPALRARQTAEAVMERLDLPREKIRFDERIYAATLPALLAVLADCPRQRDAVLLVGHNPGLDELCQFLCGEPLPRTPDGKLMTTAALAVIELPPSWDDLSAGDGRLIVLMRPKSLRPPG